MLQIFSFLFLRSQSLEMLTYCVTAERVETSLNFKSPWWKKYSVPSLAYFKKQYDTTVEILHE